MGNIYTRNGGLTATNARKHPSVVGSQPWLMYKAWATNPLRKNNLPQVWVSCTVAIFWNSLLLFIAAPSIPQMARSHSYAALGVVAFLAALGLGLAIWAFKSFSNARRFGQMRLHLDPYPGAIGGHFGATLPLKLPYRTGLQFSVALQCRSTTAEKWMDGDVYFRHSNIWRSEGLAQVAPTDGGIELHFRFD